MNIKDCKIGMTIVGTPEANSIYGVTKEGVKVKILEIKGLNVSVKCGGEIFLVNPYYFEPVSPISVPTYEIF